MREVKAMSENIYKSSRLTSIPRHQTIAPIKGPENPSFLPMLHGAATDTLARMSSRDATIGGVYGDATIETGDVKLVVRRFKELSATLGINTHKLLSVGIAEFTKQNTVGAASSQSIEHTVAIPFKEYAIKCGYDLVERETKTEAEAEAERKRLKNATDDARKKIKKDLDLLHSSEFTWTEKVRGKAQDWVSIPVIGSRGIRNGYIYMTFDPALAQYMVLLPVTQYAVALLGVDARNANAYNIGLKLVEYWNMDSNQRAGRADRIGVDTLLACTTLPSIESIRASRKDWIERIKEPFERALDVLTECGLLADWQYTHAKAVPLSDEEAMSILSFEEWAKLYIQFELRDAPDHTPRLEAKKEKAKTKRPRKPRAKKTE